MMRPSPETTIDILVMLSPLNTFSRFIKSIPAIELIIYVKSTRKGEIIELSRRIVKYGENKYRDTPHKVQLIAIYFRNRNSGHLYSLPRLTFLTIYI
jgi:hypothetical protein